MLMTWLHPLVLAAADDALEEVVVTARQIEEQPPLRPETTLTGTILQRRVESTLGATLDQELGVHNSSFGPGVGLPVVRGLSGPRVKIMQNGLGNHDASSSSPDHAVAVEPLLAEEIRVIRGPGTLRFGNGAMGGIVEINDGRIPTQVPEHGIVGAAESRYDSNGAKHAEVFKLTAGHGIAAVHLDGFLRESGNIDIPGDALDTKAVRELFGDSASFENARGRLPNSDAEMRGGTAGMSLLVGDVLVGAAVNVYDNSYGIPPGGLPPHSDIPGQAPAVQRIRIDIAQTRYDLKTEWQNPLARIDAIKLRLAHTDYLHDEVDQGRISTTFTNRVLDSRLEVEHRFAPFAPGVVGLQWTDRDFSAVGFETFVPESNIQSQGVYLTQSLELDAVTLDLGLRRDRVLTRPTDSERTIGGIVTVPLPARLRYLAHSSALGAELPVNEQLSFRLSYTRAGRAPEVQELLALGPHLSTRAFDVGNVELAVETANALDVSMNWQSHWLEVRLNLFRNRIRDFIYQENLGFLYNIEEQQFQLECVRVDICVPVFGYLQQDADFLGYEAELAVPYSFAAVDVRFSLFSDYVRAYFTRAGSGDVPRLPPRTAGLAVDLEGGRWTLGMRTSWAEAQQRAGRNETSSASYVAVNADASWSLPSWHGLDGRLFVRGRNLLDAEIRNSTSFLRMFMPEGGRSVEVGVRVAI